MKLLTLAASLVSLSFVAEAAQSTWYERIHPENLKARANKALEARRQAAHSAPTFTAPLTKRASPYLNPKTEKFVVNGTGLPDVHFDIGESYAGLLPISSAANETREIFFWFFPSQNPAASNEITVWFTGGPGCSGLLGMLQENGPFLWQPGTFLPTPNSYSWSNLTNMLYIEQPIGVGFDQGEPDIVDEYGLTREFLGFYKQFEETFEVQNRSIYITGESYGGFYVPYASDALLNASYDVKGALIYDPIIGNDILQFELPSYPFAEYWNNILNFNDTFLSSLKSKHESCGYASYIDKYFTFPPPGPFPDSLDINAPGCDTNTDVFNGAFDQNPCWNYYHITEQCPYPWNVLGSDAVGYNQPGSQVYFNRPDVQKAINAPPTNWTECVNGVFANGGTNKQGDLAAPPATNGVLQRVIEKTNNTFIGSGNLDFVLMTNGTLLAIQNMTWNGAQGFSQPPDKDHIVPVHPEYNPATLSASGIVGKYVSERGFTFATVQLSGHEVPEYAAGAAYRHLEFLLGRVDSIGSNEPFTTQRGAANTTVVGLKKPVEQEFVRGNHQ